MDISLIVGLFLLVVVGIIIGIMIGAAITISCIDEDDDEEQELKDIIYCTTQYLSSSDRTIALLNDRLFKVISKRYRRK